MNVPFKGLLLGVVYIIAVVLGIMEYGRSKGRLGRAMAVTLGGAVLATFIIEPALLTETLPGLILTFIDWLVGAAGGGGGGDDAEA